MDGRCLFLYNPNSGKKRIAKKLPYICKRLGACYREVTVHAAESAQDLQEWARRGATEYDAIVLSGGDGTFYHVLQAIGECEVPLGYLPAGTANDVAHALHIPRRVRGALRVIARGNTRTIDSMSVNGAHRVLYIAAAGAFTHVTYETPQKTKQAFGWFAYALEGLKDNLRFEPFPAVVTCGEERIEGDAVLILVMNGRYVAGFPVNRKGSMQDGTLEIAVIRQMRRTGALRKLASLLSLAHLFLFGCRVRKRDIRLLRGDRVTITAPEGVTWDFDGEAGCSGTVEICVKPRSVRVFVPKKKKI